jgi:transposase-like protein
MGQRRRFTPEFKRQALQLLNAGQRPAVEIARELAFLAIGSINGRRKSLRMAGRSRAGG